jgi:hypothetical protein
MVRIDAMLCLFAMVAFSAATESIAHGCMSSPTPCGIEKIRTRIDEVKDPNTRGICRNGPAGRVTNVGRKVTLRFTIIALHIDMCEVYPLDTNFGNTRHIT